MLLIERKSAIISPETMRVTAFHEAGHALVALMTEGCDPIHKVQRNHTKSYEIIRNNTKSYEINNTNIIIPTLIYW